MSPESKNDAIAESKEERTPFLQQYIVAPARFILFILSLTFLARKNDFQLFRARKRNSRDRAKERSRKRRSQSKDRKSLKDHGPGTALSDTENSASDGSVGEDCPLAGPPRVLRGFQRQLGVWEVSLYVYIADDLTNLSSSRKLYCQKMCFCRSSSVSCSLAL